MNDRFNFRCWDKENKKFLHPLSFDICYNGTLIINCGIEGKKYINLNDTDRYILMQCTGLKDKNGKLIYEGDIVKRYFICRSSIGDIVEENLFTVKFEDLRFGLFQIAILKGGTDYSPFLNFDEALELEEYAEEMEEITLEVLGNIYENPELLKEYKDE